MADIIDQANDRAEMDLQRALTAALRSAPVLPFIGECHNCSEPLPGSLRFCDADCRSDFELRKQAESRR